MLSALQAESSVGSRWESEKGSLEKKTQNKTKQRPQQLYSASSTLKTLNQLLWGSSPSLEINFRGEGEEANVQP